MRTETPTLHCDGDDCDSWEVDYWEQTASTVDGIRITMDARAPGWTTSDNEDLCPECTQALADEAGATS